MVHRLTREEARRIAVRAQLLTADRPGGIVEAVDGLALVNIDPTAAVAPSADHILWSRIGWPYQAADLAHAVEDDRAIFEWAGFYRPMADLSLYLPMMRAWPRVERAPRVAGGQRPLPPRRAGAAARRGTAAHR